MGYPSATSGSGFQAMKFSGISVAASEACPAAMVGAMNLPALFSRVAIAMFRFLAYPYSMYPIAPGVVLILAVTPSLPLDLVPMGQFGMLLVPGLFLNSSLIALRCWVNTKVVPLLSARTTTLIGELGSFAPGFAAAISGSFQFLILPRNIPE